MNDFYPSSEFLRLRFEFESNKCVFCKSDTETTEHLFITCSQMQLFWKLFTDWLKRKNSAMPDLDYNSVVFGVILKDKQLDLMVDVLQILAKFFIHNAKYLKTTPVFSCFSNEFLLYIKSLKFIESKFAKDFYFVFKNDLTNEA